MDPFSKLPSLVQTRIFIHLHSESSITQLKKASPSMLSHFTSYKKCILRTIVTEILHDDTSGGLLRDAAGIIYISDTTRTRNFHHLSLWQTLELPDLHSLDDLQTLFRLFSRVIIFIEDYITKATSVYPPRSFLGIPDLVVGTGTCFKRQTLDADVVRFTSLTRDERYRFLRGFLRYELLCRLYDPRAWRLAERFDIDFQVILDHGSGGMPDKMALTSIHDYYKSLYGALFAQCQPSWLPECPIPPTHKKKSGEKAANEIPHSQHGLLFPDNLMFDATVYFHDLGFNRPHYVKALTCLGLDLLSQLITFLNHHESPGEYIRAWLQRSLRSFNSTSPWINSLCDAACEESWPIYDRLLEGQRVCRRRDPEIIEEDIRQYQFSEYSGGWIPRWLRLHNYQLCIYRQQAWGLFDDQRLYPTGQKHFPTLDELAQLERKLTEEEVLSPALERSRRRSQKWQDYYASKLLEPPVEECDEENAGISLKGYLAPCKRFFETSYSDKLPII